MMFLQITKQDLLARYLDEVFSLIIMAGLKPTVGEGLSYPAAVFICPIYQAEYALFRLRRKQIQSAFLVCPFSFEYK
jgi:hypothetical protein